MAKITKLVATIGKKQYRLVPSASCKGCAFEAKCYRLGSFFGRCPAFNDYDLASDINAIFKEIK